MLTGADVPGEGDTGPARRDEPLFPGEVMFHHQPVAWVLAETLDDAQRGAARVIAEYEALPAILTIDEAIAQEAYLAGPFRITRGDMDAMETCALRCTGELRIGGQEHFYLETQAALAWLDETGGVALHSSTQHPSETQEVVARVLGVPRHRVTVECLRMGGGFGGKETQASAWAAIAALGAWKTKRPVRVRLTRQLDMALTGKRHPYLARYEAGFAEDGTLQALRLSLWSDGGYSLDLSTAIMWRSMFHCDNAYHLRAVDVVGHVCHTHKTSQTALRGFGGPQGMVVIEEILAQGAARLGLPAETIRERNFYRPGDVTHYGQTVEGADRVATIWTTLKDTSAFDRRRAEIAAFNAGSPHLKRGLAITPAKFGISFTATFYNQGSALVLVYRDGSVQVNHGGTEMGQGLFTKIRQIAAGALGVSPDRVRLMPTRTDKVPNTSATAASSGTDLNGAAVEDACRQIIARLVDGGGRHPRVRPVDGAGVGGPGQRRRALGAVCRRLRSGVPRASAALRAGFLPHAWHPLRSGDRPGSPVLLLHVRRRRVRGGSGRLHRRPPPAACRHPPGCGRHDLAHRRPRADRGRLHPGCGVAHGRGPAVGCGGPRRHGQRVHVQAALVVRGSRDVRGGVPAARDTTRRGVGQQGCR